MTTLRRCSSLDSVVAAFAASLLVGCTERAPTAPRDSTVMMAARTEANTPLSAAQALASFDASHRALSSGNGNRIATDANDLFAGLLGQSPVDIRVSSTSKLLSTDPQFAWKAFAPEFETEHELKVKTARHGGHVTIRGTRYELDQFHFHYPSEHTINGRQSAMEVHFVHIAPATNAIAVIGVLLDVGAESAALASLLSSSAHADAVHAGEAQASGLQAESSFDPSSLLPSVNSPYFTYSGSLTTGAFAEGLTWIVYKQPIRLSAAQLREYAATFTVPNARATQPLHGRTVFERVGGGR